MNSGSRMLLRILARNDITDLSIAHNWDYK